MEADTSVQTVKLRNPEYSRFSDYDHPDFDADNPMGWSLSNVKQRFKCCRRYDPNGGGSPIPFVFSSSHKVKV
jgi:hypothetical protein